MFVSCLGTEDELQPSQLNMVTSCEFGADIVSYTSDFVRNSAGEMVEVHDTTTYSADEFPFTIDQINKLIYLEDSLPYGSRIDKMPITIHSAGAYGVRLVDDGNGGEEEVAWLSTDSLDLREPVRIRVYASDEISTSTYTIKVTVHQVEPDSLIWNKVSDSFSAGEAVGRLRTVVLGDELLTFAETSAGLAVYKNNWQAVSSVWDKHLLGTDMAEAEVGSAQVFGGKVFMTTADGQVKVSSDGVAWQTAQLDGQVETLVGTITTGGISHLVTIVSEDGVKKFKLTTDGNSWGSEEGIVPESFPIDNFTGFECGLATNSSHYRLCVMGTEDPLTAINDTTTFAWFTLDGVDWTEMEGASTLRLPKLTLPTMIYYAGETLAFGTGDNEKLSRLFTSEDYGLVWREKTKDMRLEYSFEGRTNYSAVVDGDNWLWVFFSNENGGSDVVWRGRVNRLGFDD